MAERMFSQQELDLLGQTARLGDEEDGTGLKRRVHRVPVEA